MDLLHKVLEELNFRKEASFNFKANEGTEEEQELDVFPFVWREHPSQVYLLVELNYKNLSLVLHKDFLAKLATAFCKQQFHTGEMDRNTSLVVKSLGELEDLKDMSLKIKIEDDPHYFKKYVFVFTEQAEQNANKYFDERASVVGDKFSLVSEIQNLLMNEEEFENYKNDTTKLDVYSYAVELTTKIPVLPLNIESVSSFKSLDSFFNEELKNAKKPIKATEIKKLLSKNIDFNNINTDEFLDIWKECFDDTEEN